MVRPRFTPNRPLVAARAFPYLGVQYRAGDPFPAPGTTTIADFKLRTLYGSRLVNHTDGDAAPAEPSPVTVEKGRGGFYVVNAPWLQEPVKLRGKDKADYAAEQIRDAGPPLGFIEGGSLVTVSALGGGWYAVDAPWLEEAEKLQGRDDAESRQRELHAAGEPDTYAGVTLTAGSNGWYEIAASWMAKPEKVQGEEAARERAREVRRRGAPKPADLVEVTKRGRSYQVTAPWLAQPIKLGDEDKAEYAAGQVRLAGPPMGWVAGQ
jgi:hypothetical protein